MRTAIVGALLLLCACGDWSNEDLEYVYALPDSAALKSQLGETGTAGQGIRRDPLLGDHSDVYEQTKTGNDQFNLFLDSVLKGLDTLRKIHPTTRETNKRIWGPYPDDQHKGFDVKAEIVKTGERTYEWSLQARLRGGGEFVVLGGGNFVATESLRKGRGSFFFDAVAGNALYGTTKAKPEDPDRIEVGYQTSSDPVIVEVDVVVPALAVPFSYDFNRYADGSAVLTYTVSGLMDPNATKVSALAAWNPKGAGVTVYTILEGNYKTAMAKQCWNETQNIVFGTGNWTGAETVGVESDCAEVPTLLPLPPFP